MNCGVLTEGRSQSLREEDAQAQAATDVHAALAFRLCAGAVMQSAPGLDRDAHSVRAGLLAGLERRPSRRRPCEGLRESLSLRCGVFASPSLLPEADPVRLVLSWSKVTFTKSSPCNLINVKSM